MRGLPNSVTVKAVGLIALIFTPVCAYILWTEMSSRHSRAREQLVCVSGRLALGQSRSQFRTVLADCDVSQLRLHDDPDGSVLETPARFGARNWLLYVDWKGDAIRCLRIRTADSVNERPGDAGGSLRSDAGRRSSEIDELADRLLKELLEN
jgi:hypothetical protein